MQCPAETPYMHSDGLCYPEEEGNQNNLNNGYTMEGGARRRRSTRKSGRKGTRKSRQNARQNVAARKNRQNTMRKNRRNGRKDRR